MATGESDDDYGSLRGFALHGRTPGIEQTEEPDLGPDLSTGQSCAQCEEPATWAHHLARRLGKFSTYGRGSVLGRYAFCDRCERLYQDGNDGALVALEVEALDAGHLSAHDIFEQMQKPLDALRRADLGSYRIR